MRRLLAASALATGVFVPSSNAGRIKTMAGEKDAATLPIQQSEMSMTGLTKRRDRRKHGERDGGDDDDDDGGDDHPGDDDDDKESEHEDDDKDANQSGNSGPGYPESTSRPTPPSTIQNPISHTSTLSSPSSTTSLPVSSTSPFADSLSSMTTGSALTNGGEFTTQTTSSISTASSTSNNSAPTSFVNQAGDTDNISDGPGGNNDASNPNAGAKSRHLGADSIAGGVVGGVLLLLGLLFIWHCTRTRRKRREWLEREKAASTNDSDLESHSHVTVDLRNWSGSSSVNGTRSSNEISDYSAVSRLHNTTGISTPGSPPSTSREVIQHSVPITLPRNMIGNTDGNASPSTSSVHQDFEHHPQVSGLPPNPGYNDPFADIYGTPSPTYSQASLHTHRTHQTHSYPAIPARTLPVQAPVTIPSLPTPAHFNSMPIPVDGPPPPQYPGGVTLPALRCCSSHSTIAPQLPVSPLSPHPLPTSDLDAILGTKPEAPPPPPRPEIVSPIYQMGQTSATLDEFDEAAIVDGVPPAAPLAYNDEKQAIGPQEGVSRN